MTGGAGYIGSHTVLHFRSLGWRTVVLDDLSTGHVDLAALADRFVCGSLLDEAVVARLFDEEPLDGVVHCAARSLVGESVRDPVRYYHDNVLGAAVLVRACAARQVPVVFSSTAAVYGEPETVPIPEDAPLRPINPYGRSKLAIEWMLADAGRAHGLGWTALRYFNAAGADPEGRAGERHEPETHLVPNVFRAMLRPEAAPFRLFGEDYPTEDGTCVRDFVHVLDVAEAHRLALQRLWDGAREGVFNLGHGRGYSVRQVLEAAQRVTGRLLRIEVAPRRPGDPAVLIADPTRARQQLGWRPRHSGLEPMLRSAWRWHEAEAVRGGGEERGGDA